MPHKKEAGEHSASSNQSATSAERLASGLGWFSIALGLAEVAAPRAICRALGAEGRETLVRSYGVREIMTGVAILATHDPAPYIVGRVAGDALDLATLGAGLQGDNPKKDNVGLAIAAVVGVTALDIFCAQQLTSQKRLSRNPARDYSNRTGYPRSIEASRGAARDLEVPRDFRIPEPLRPWASA